MLQRVAAVAIVFAATQFSACTPTPSSAEPFADATRTEPATSGIATVPAPPVATAKSSSSLVPKLQRLCLEICGRSRDLKCKHGDGCAANCLAMASAPPCTEQFLVFYECIAKQPARNWECSEDGVAAIREGFCEKEQEQTVLCMESNARD
jgi:hypothetical protein